MAGNTIRFTAFLDDKVSKPLAKVRDTFDRAGKSAGFKAVAQGVGIGAGISAYNLLGTAISGVVDFTTRSIEAGSRLNESISKSNVIFGDSARSVEDWGGTLAKSFGISKQAGIEAAASFGNVFVGLDFGEQKAAEMSKRMVELAGDLASFNNLATDDALQKLRAGLAGEAEPLRAVGVFLTEAKVKAKAMELGLAGAHGEISEGAKIAARYNLILEETATAQGDAARTGGQLAGQQRETNARWEDFVATVGQALIPVAEDATGSVLGLADAGEVVGEKFSEVEVNGVKPLEEGVKMMGETFKTLIFPLLTVGDILGELTNDEQQAAEKAALMGRIMDRGAERIGRVADATDEAVDPMRDLRRATAATALSFSDLVDNASEWADFVYANVEGADDLKHEYSLANDELRDARKELRKLEEIKNPTKEQRRDLKETRVRVDELERRAFNLGSQLAALGNKPARDAIRPYLDSLRGKLEDGIITAREYREALSALGANYRSSRQTGKSATGRRRGQQAGGYVPPGWMGTVGEGGIEGLVMFPGGGGYVVPNQDMATSSLSNAGGGDVHVNVTLDGEVVYRSVERRQIRDDRIVPTTV